MSFARRDPRRRAGERLPRDRGHRRGLRRPRLDASRTERPACSVPSRNALGVVTTPARTPERNCALTAATTASERRSASKRATSRPSRSARSHRCGSSSRPWSANSASCIGQNAPWQRRGLGRAGRGVPARGCEDLTGKCRKQTCDRVLAQLQLERRAVRALVVAVDDHQPSLPAHVIGGADRGQRGGAEVAQDRASKIRLAPGRTPGCSASWLHVHRAVAVDDHERPLREAARVVDAERPAGRALGLEVRELLDLDAELLLEGALRVRRVAGDAVERRALGREVLEHLVVERELVRADRREGERVEDEDRRAPEQLLAREVLAVGRLQREVGRGLAGPRRWSSAVKVG